MPRIETELMEGWEFAKGEHREEGFHPVSLPHDWAIDAPFDREMEEGGSQGFRSRFGIGWYRREVWLSGKEAGHRYLLFFGGIYEDSTVWVNGEEAGGRKYGYSSFTLDVTALLKEGANQVEIRVDNTRCPSDRWYGGAGIYRTVKLIQVEEVHFDPWEVVTETRMEGQGARIVIHTGRQGQLSGEQDSPGRIVRAELRDRDGILAAWAEGTGETLELALVQARPWSAEDPYLYRLDLLLLGREGAGDLDGAGSGHQAWGQAEGHALESNRAEVRFGYQKCPGDVIHDRISLHMGLRRVELLPGKGLYVNGRQVKLKGVCIHQDVGCLGTAARKEIFRQRLLALKETGCNAIRPAHHTYCSEFLDLCDEMGFYVYEECFDKWHGGLYGRYFQTEWKRDVEAMVKRDRNRPCILMWGVGNEVENQGQESMLATLKLLTEYVRTLDTRPVSYAMNPHFKRESQVDLSQVKDIQQFVDEVSDTEITDNRERVERIAKIAAYVDVISCNYQEQWYPLIHERIPDKLILGTEVYQYFSGAPDQMQNFTDVNPVLAVRGLDYCLGSFIWTGIDYLGESMGWPAKGWGGSLIRTNGSRRPGYYLMQSYWSEKPMVHFSVMDYSLSDEGVKEHWDIPMLADHWHFPQFRKTVIPYVIMSNCQEVRLYLNGKRFYLPRPADCRNHMITGFLPYLPGTVEVVGVNNGQEVCREVIRTPGEAAALRFVGDAWTFSMENGGMAHTAEEPEGMFLPALQDYRVQLSLQAVDREGSPCFREQGEVRFRVEGPARLLAVDAGELVSDAPYRTDRIRLFRGQASVMLALTGQAGEVRVYGEGESLEAGCMRLYVQEEG